MPRIPEAEKKRSIQLSWTLFDNERRTVRLCLRVEHEGYQKGAGYTVRYREDWSLADEPASPLVKACEIPIKKDTALTLLHNAPGPIEEASRPCSRCEFDDLMDANTEVDPREIDSPITIPREEEE